METPSNKSTATPAIEMRGVAIGSLRNPLATRFSEIDWTVAPNEFWVVAAPQYSGKTDFLMTVGGLIGPTSGEYFLFGAPMPIFEEDRLKDRLKLGLVFDGGQLFSQLTIAENIALPLRYHWRSGEDDIESQVKTLLQMAGLERWAHSTPANLGRSLQQRAGLMRALTLRPELLLLDSPLTGLDARHIDWWLDFLDQLKRGHEWMGGKPMTLVATADDLRPWRGHATHVACLSDKKLSPLGDWQAAERTDTPVMRELLRAEVAHD